MSWRPATLCVMSTPAERARWRQRAVWLTQLGLDRDEAAPADVAEELGDAALALLAEVERLEEQVLEARRIGAWLYGHLDPGARIFLGDVSEWPWLLEGT